MNRYASFVLSFSILLGSFGFISAVSAQEEPLERVNFCPDFGKESVRVVLTVPSSSAIAGTLLPIKATFANITEQPLSGGLVLAKLVARSLDDKKLAALSGTTFARVAAFENMSLPVAVTINKEFSLSLPQNLPAGAYDLQVFYALSDEFNLENPDSEATLQTGANMAVLSLSIENGVTSSFAFIDAKSVRINDGGVSVTLINTGVTAASVPVLWKAYAWNALAEKALVESKVELVEVPALGKKTVSYEIVDDTKSSYQIVVQIDSEGVRTFATVAVDAEKGGSIIKLAGIAPFPSETGTVHAYACVHNVYSDDETERLVHLSVTDTSGKTIGEGTFPVHKGVNEFQVVKPVTVRGGDVTLLASVVSLGQAEQVVTRQFSCAEFGCTQTTNTASETDQFFILTLLAAGTGGLLTMRYYLKHVRHHRTAEPPSNLPKV